MKKINLHITGFILFTFFILLSCSQNDPADEVKTGVGNQIRVKFYPVKPQLSKAALEEGQDALNENSIKTLDIFIYEENGDACFFYQHVDLSPVHMGTSEFSEVLNITQESFSLNVNYTTYVVANFGYTGSDTGASFTELKKMLLTDLNPDILQESFVMDGTYTMILNNGEIVNKDVPVNLNRAAAKIRLSLNYPGEYTIADNSEVTKKVINYASQSSLLSDGDPVIPVLKNMSSFTAQNSGAGNTNNIIVYSYANDWNDSVRSETYLVLNIPLKDTQGNIYSPNYYKVPVNYRLPEDNDLINPTPEQEEARKALFRLQRNYLYDVNVFVDKLGTSNPDEPEILTANYVIEDWTTEEILVAVEGANFIYVRDTIISMPITTSYTTTFQSSSPDVRIQDIYVNDVLVANGTNGVSISWTQNTKSGNIVINSDLPTNFYEKTIRFTVINGAGLSENVHVSQYPDVYLSSDVSLETPGGSQGQNNKKMYIINSLTADYSKLKNPDEFDEDFGSGYYHYDPDPDLGASYALYIRRNAVLGFPLLDSNGVVIDSDENNRRISPRFMLASQYGTTTAANYVISRQKCLDYVERDSTTMETYSDWRMPTVAELYMIDILQNTSASEVKKILEGNYYWSSRASSTIKFMDPRVGQNTNFGPLNAAVRCVRDVKK